MRVSLPHMGNVYIPLKTLFQELNVDIIIPPLSSRRTLSLATKYSPEGLCIPFKLTLGNFIEAAEMGADTLLMAGGYGICRLGYYAKTQEQILRDMGYNVKILRLGVSEHKLRGFMDIVKRLSNNASWSKIIPAFRFGIAKLDALDDMEREVHKVRPRELSKGTANRTYAGAIKAIDEADSYKSVKRVRKDYLEQLRQLPQNYEAHPLLVSVIGEFFVVLDPFSNLDVENELGKLGVEVRRSLYISDWTKFNLFFGIVKKFRKDEKTKFHEAAMPYLKCDVGGEGWETVGEKVLYSKTYDGLVHLAPFTCMPEIVAQNIMPITNENIPVLTIYCDEQMGKSGMLTRLEAFVDLLKRRRQKFNN